ncbi:hypothetical protein AALP_AA8G500600 [Arabis alpina]|uniref:DUF4408 domain-containing protein n=1 Tax=Arabis alpina TaxID=50452 RepID=A0A087GEL6_ARAAL|nr:hypothetical protein AALP_AA8G500600 [Arabis alpina]
MDLFDFDNVKAEKAKAMRRYRRIGRFFRAAEICVALLFACWTFSLLPFAVRISGEFLRRIAAVISTPLFVFLLGNAIVVVLLTKSSDQTTGDSAVNAESQVYDAFVRSVENRSKPSDEDLTEEIVYDDKQVIVTDSNPNLIENENIPHVDSDSVSYHRKVYRRSKSDVVSAKMVVVQRSLQRSETDKCREIEVKSKYPQDKLSEEEFQKTVDAFLANNSMFRRQQSNLAVVVHNKSLI